MESATDQSSESYLFTMTSVTTSSLCTNIQQNSSDVPATPSYEEDPKGAFLFCVAVVCIYGLSIVAFIGSHVKKRHVNKDEERQISLYLKNGHHPVNMNGNQFRVLRFKTSALMCSTLGQRRHLKLTSHAESKSSRHARSSFENSDHKNNPEKVDDTEDNDNESFLPQREKPRPSEALQQVVSIPLKLRMPGQDHLNFSLGGSQEETVNSSSDETDPLRAPAGGDDAEVESSGVKDDEAMLTFIDELTSKQENCVELLSNHHIIAESHAVNCLFRESTDDTVETSSIHVNGVTVSPANSTGESGVVWQAAVSAQKPRQSTNELRVMDPEVRAIRPFRGRRSALFPI